MPTDEEWCIASRSGDPKLTGAGIALGSLHYMSPEQMKAEALDARSDLYSVGVKVWDPAVLENVRKNLAVYVGPMAKVLVSRAARNTQS